MSKESLSRVLETLPTVRHLVDAGAKVVLASHLGDPGKKGVTSASPSEKRAPFSLKPVGKALSEFLLQKVLVVCLIAIVA